MLSFNLNIQAAAIQTSLYMLMEYIALAVCLPFLSSWTPCAEQYFTVPSESESKVCSVHRIIWVGRDPQRPSNPTPFNEPGHPQLEQGAQNPSTLTLDVSRDGGPPPLWTVPVSHHSYQKNFFSVKWGAWRFRAKCILEMIFQSWLGTVCSQVVSA